MKNLIWVLIGGFVLMQIMSKAFDGDMMEDLTTYDNVLEYQSRDGYMGGQSAHKGYNRAETRYDYVPRRSERTGRYIER